MFKISMFSENYVNFIDAVFQVKMKNLRREVRIFKETKTRLNPRKPSEVANACEKLMPVIEEIFNTVLFIFIHLYF